MNCDRWTSQGTNRSFNCSMHLTHERAVPVHSSSTDTQETQKGKENALPCAVSKPQPCGSSTQTYTHHLNVCFDRRPRWDHIWTTPLICERFLSPFVGHRRVALKESDHTLGGTLIIMYHLWLPLFIHTKSDPPRLHNYNLLEWLVKCKGKSVLYAW